jgi:hypothetical protein
VDGFHYRRVTGGYRLAALSWLNENDEEWKANCPPYIAVFVQPTESAVSRLDIQVMENMSRQNMSPIDTAIAAQAYLDAELTKTEVCEKLGRPGGRKGFKIQPLSNASLNDYLRLLDFTQPIQDKIDNGTLSMASALTLWDYPKEQWAEILEEEERVRLAAIDKQEARDERFDARERKEALAEEKKTQEENALATAKQQLAAAKASKVERKEAMKPLAQALAAANKEGTKEEKEAARKAHAAAQHALSAAEKAVGTLTEQVERQAQRLEKRDAPPEPKAKAKEAKGKKSKAQPPKTTPRTIAKAAAAVGAESSGGRKVLNARDMAEAINDLTKAAYPKVKAIGKVIERMRLSELTPSQAVGELALITGEVSKAKTAREE